MNIIQKAAYDADTQVLIEAGYLTGDLKMTDRGTAMLLKVMFLKNKAKMVENAKVRIEALEA